MDKYFYILVLMMAISLYASFIAWQYLINQVDEMSIMDFW